MKVHELLDRPERWCKRASAKNAQGERCDPLSHEAVCWCLTGALRVCYAEIGFMARELLATQAVKHLQGQFRQTTLMFFNDDPLTTFPMLRQFLLEADL